MATTKLSDTIKAQPKVFAAMIRDQVNDLSKFRNAGIITGNALLDERAVGAGFETTIPSWAPLYNTAEASSADDSDTNITPRKVSANNLRARRYHRAIAYEAANIVQNSIGKDPLEFAASQLARIWVDDEEALLMAMLKAIETDYASEFVKSVKIATGTIVDANLLNPTSVIDGKQLMGDAAGRLNKLIVHSDVYANMQKKEPNAFVPVSASNANIVRYLGLYDIIVSDRMGKDTTVSNYPVYTSYLFGAGAFGYGNGGGEVKIVNNELAGMGWGKETIVSRSSFIMHPEGFDCAATPANSVSLTNAEAQATGAFVKVAERKSVPFVAVKTNG